MNSVNKAARRPWPLTRWLIWTTALLRGLAYPLLIIASLATVGVVARARSGDFWWAQSYGGVMLAAALSGLALAIVRLGDGRFERDNGKLLRRSARQAAGFWLISFIAVCVAILLVTVIHRLPATIESPWLRAQGSAPPACTSVTSCPGEGGTTPRSVTGLGETGPSGKTRANRTGRTS